MIIVCIIIKVYFHFTMSQKNIISTTGSPRAHAYAYIVYMFCVKSPFSLIQFAANYIFYLLLPIGDIFDY